MDNWKCDKCGSENDPSVSLRCSCGHYAPSPSSKPGVLKGSGIVVAISFIVGMLVLPFAKYLPTTFKIFVDHYASIIGYIILCYMCSGVEIWRLLKISLSVSCWFVSLNLIMYHDAIGSKYTLKGILLGGVLDEGISVIAGCLLYYTFTRIKSTISVKNDVARPRWLRETTILMCIFNFAGFIFYDSSLSWYRFELFLLVACFMVSFLVLWYYWQGNNFARILVIGTSVVSLISLYDIVKYSSIQRSLIVAEAVLGLFLLWWLNTSNVKKYFHNTK